MEARPVRLRWFGAKGDDATDDTAALKRWIASIAIDGEGAWDPGTYRISSTLNVGTHGIRLLNPSGWNPFGGATVKWDSPNSSSFAINMCGLRQTIEGVHVAVASGRVLHGGINVGSVSGSTVLYNTVRKCGAAGDSTVGGPTLDYGFGMGIWSEGGILTTNEQSFARYEDCIASNYQLAGFRLEGCANSIDTTIEGCLALNSLGVSGSSRWVSASNAGIAGLVSGGGNPYGVGIWCGGTASGGIGFNPNTLRVIDFNSLYNETALWVDNIMMYNVLWEGGDSENTKKLIKAHWGGTGIPAQVSLRGGRFTINPEVRSIGPANNGLGYAASDTRWLDVVGYGVHMDSCSPLHGGGVDLTQSMYVDNRGGSLIVTNCGLPSTQPFHPACDVWSMGCFGGTVAGNYRRLQDGHWGGMPVGNNARYIYPTHFDGLQSYQRISLNPMELTGTQPSKHAYPDVVNVTVGSNRANSISFGRVNIIGTNQAGACAFSVSNSTAMYDVVLTMLTSSGGTPHSCSMNAIAINKTTTGFSAWVSVAPGVGVTNTYRWELVNDL